MAASLDTIDKIYKNLVMILTKNIDNPKLSKLISQVAPCNIETGPWIAGGCARRMWFDATNWVEYDIDFFFSNYNDLHSYASKLIEYLGINQYHRLDQFDYNPSTMFETENAITFDIDNMSIGKFRVQFIKKYYCQSAISIFDKFDFTVCNFVTDGKVVLADSTAVDHCNKKLLTKNLKNINCVASPTRVIKYGIYGFLADNNIMQDIVDLNQSGKLLDMCNDGYV